MGGKVSKPPPIDHGIIYSVVDGCNNTAGSDIGDINHHVSGKEFVSDHPSGNIKCIPKADGPELVHYLINRNCQIMFVHG